MQRQTRKQTWLEKFDKHFGIWETLLLIVVLSAALYAWQTHLRYIVNF